MLSFPILRWTYPECGTRLCQRASDPRLVGQEGAARLQARLLLSLPVASVGPVRKVRHTGSSLEFFSFNFSHGLNFGLPEMLQVYYKEFSLSHRQHCTAPAVQWASYSKDGVPAQCLTVGSCVLPWESQSVTTAV